VPVEVANESGAEVDAQALATLARFVLDAMGVSPSAELSVLLVDVPAMTELHVKWMDEPGPTDVLAFPMDELLDPGRAARGGGAGSRPDDESAPGEPMLLGDVVLCPEVAGQQARQAGHSAEAELHLLCTHGVLHLLGYDHGEPDEEKEMFGLQRQLLEQWSARRGGEGVRAP
jgi:probable rRNA maturation factor